MAPSLPRLLTSVVSSAVLAAVGVSGAQAKGPVRSTEACTLLTSAELENALGVKGERPLVGMEIPFTKDATHDHAGSLFTCQGKIGDRFVLVTFGSRPVTAEGRKRAEDRIAQSQEELRTKGYTVRTESQGGVDCWTMAAPPGDTSAQAMFGTTCGGVKGADFYAITVSANGRDDIIPIGKLRILAETAASRLP
jgi:hypothetical protein